MKNLLNMLKRFSKWRLFGPFITLALVLMFNVIFTPGFFHLEIKDGHLFGSLIDILNRGSSTMIMAVGLTFVVATGGIDISIGSMIAITGAVAATLIGGELVIVDGVQEYVSLLPMPIAILAALAVAIALGMWNGTLVARIGIQPVVATLILLTAGRGIAQLLTKGQIITIYYKPYHFIGTEYLLGLPFSIYIVVFILILSLLTVKKTALGLFIESAGCNPVASKFAGIKVKKIIFWSYVFCSFCAGIAGLIISSNVKSADGNNAGLFKEMDVILAVALGGNSLNGGRFSLVGSVIGALIVQSIDTTIYSVGIPPQISKIIKAVAVIIICLAQSQPFNDKMSKVFKKRGGLKYEENAVKL